MQPSNDRIMALELRLRRLQIAAAACFVALVVVSAAAMQKADENLQLNNLTAQSISTGSFTLRDQQGKPRVAIRMGDDGGPFVSLLDANSRVRLLLSLHENEHPLVQFSNADEAPQMNMFYNKNLGSGIIMLGSAGRALYAVPTGGTPIVELNDGDGTKIFGAP